MGHSFLYARQNTMAYRCLSVRPRLVRKHLSLVPPFTDRSRRDIQGIGKRGSK